jgi:hypothetical protein
MTMHNGTHRPAPRPTPATVAHANGLTFRIIDGNSQFARVARNVRTLVMADGTTWTVGAPIGWRGQEAAWRPVETPAQEHTRIQQYGESIQRRDRRQLGLRIAPLAPTGTAALHRLEVWAAHVLRDRQKQEATA